MPGRDGLALARAIKGDPHLAAGADHYLAKPFSPLALLAAVEQALGQAAPGRLVAAPPVFEGGPPEQSLAYAADLRRLYDAERQRRHEVEEANRALAAANAELDRRLDDLLAAQDESEARLEALQRAEQQQLAYARDLRRAYESERARRAEIQSALEVAEAASPVKCEFLATMSHELRTPLNAILGFSELLLDGDLSPKQQRHVENVHRSATTLLALVQDILEFSDVETGQTPLAIGDCAVPEIVAAAVEPLAVQARSKGLELTWQVEPDVPGALRGDPAALSEVLHRLVDNAIKFTQAGELVVRVRPAPPASPLGTPPSPTGKAEYGEPCPASRPPGPPLSAPEGEAQGEAAVLRFEVTDTGIGIASEVCERLFQPFSQADSSGSRRYGGMGLGLALCKRLVEQMGGEIGVESEPGRGSTFWFTARLHRPC